MKLAAVNRSYSLLVGGIVLLSLACGALWFWPALESIGLPLMVSQQRAYAGIEIRGDEAFIAQVEQSLQLLREKSPDSFAVVQRYVGRIREHSRSGMRAYADPPTFDLAARSSHHSVTWCAGAIAHDAYHSKLYHEHRSAHGAPVPYDAWSGQSREIECNAFQLRALKDIGAPASEVQYLSELDGSHFDVDGDGDHDWSDYSKQDW